MQFEDFNWMGIEDYLKQDNRVILVLGACEQHGYLSLMTDTKIPLALAEAASDATGVDRCAAGKLRLLTLFPLLPRYHQPAPAYLY